MTNERNLRIPLHNKDIESAILGAILLSTDVQHMIMPKLFTELFYVGDHRVVFNAAKYLYDRNAMVDIITCYEQIKRNGDDLLIEGPYFLTRLTNSVVSNSRIDTHMAILFELYVKREMGRLTHEVNSKCYDETSDSFEIMNELINKAENTADKVFLTTAKDMTYYVAEMLKQLYLVKNTGVIGLRTGIESIDLSIGGLCPSDLIVIAARPSQGKTALALSITHNLSVKHDIPCAWFSLEMDGIQLVRRLVSINSNVEHGKIKEGRTSEKEEEKIQESSWIVSSSNIHIEDTPMVTIRDIRARSVVLKKKFDIKYIVIDYLQLIESNERNKSREQVVSDLSRGLKILAKELNIPVIALSQLNRSVEARADKMPNLSDLRESGAIEQDADSVIFIMRPEYYGFEDNDIYGGKDIKGLAIIKVDKNRHGETGAYYSHFDGTKMLFSNYL